jgi:hypothetical protein
VASGDTIWTGGTLCDPSGRMMLTVLDIGSTGGWLYFDGVPLLSCAPLPCGAPLDRSDASAASPLRPGRRYRDAETGLCFRCLRSAPGVLQFGSTLLNLVEVTPNPRRRQICMHR